MAEVLPFPLTRRRVFIARQAARMAELRPEKAENHLRRILEQQAETFARKGVAADAIAREVRQAESSIRAELWRVVLTPGGAA